MGMTTSMRWMIEEAVIKNAQREEFNKIVEHFQKSMLASISTENVHEPDGYKVMPVNPRDEVLRECAVIVVYW